jgi:hypothetical protein
MGASVSLHTPFSHTVVKQSVDKSLQFTSGQSEFGFGDWTMATADENANSRNFRTLIPVVARNGFLSNISKIK